MFLERQQATASNTALYTEFLQTIVVMNKDNCNINAKDSQIVELKEKLKDHRAESKVIYSKLLAQNYCRKFTR